MLIFRLCLFSAALCLATPALSSDYVDSLVGAARTTHLSEQMQWIRLMHYQKTLLGRWESQAMGGRFFLAKDGRTDPEAELEADIRGFFSTALGEGADQHPRCQFPARYRWLKSVLKFDESKLPPADCSRFEKFAEKVDPQSVSVVFSAYYLNNPSSAFGHSFLRLNKSADPKTGMRYELLDYGINYAANQMDSNPLLYAIKGIGGFYRGVFTSVPYYYKVREYNDFEARDLWSYDVNLTAEQMKMLVAHFWELGSTYFDYYYFTQNCSYHVLTALEAANPALTLTDRNPKIVIPSDTIRVVAEEPGFVRSIHYRPSIRAQFEYRTRDFSSIQIALLKDITESRDPSRLPQTMSAAERAAVLDAEADYMDLRYNQKLVEEDAALSAWKQKVLLARSQIPLQSAELQVPTPLREMPHIGHPSRRLSPGYGYNQRFGIFSTLEMRFAMQDLLDPGEGYPEYAQIEFGNFRVRENFGKKANFWLDDVTLFSVVSLTPYTTFMHKFSWRANVEATRFYDKNCEGCLGELIEAGGGMTLKPFINFPFSFYLFGEAEAAAAPGFIASRFRPGFGPGAGARLRLSEHLMLLARGNYRYQLFSGPRDKHTFDFGTRWELFKNFAIGARDTVYTSAHEASANIYFYF